METLLRNYARNFDETDWFKAVYAACIAAVVFLVLQMMIAAFIQGYGPWMPVRMIGAIALGTGALAETGFPVGVLIVAFLLHLGLSIATAWVLAPVVHGNTLAMAALTGAAAGVLIYLVNFHVLVLGFTWFEGIRGWATLLNHLIFGAVLTASYHLQTAAARPAIRGPDRVGTGTSR